MSNPVPSSRQLSQSRGLLTQVMQARYADQARLNEELATGLKVRKGSDDPTAYGIARRLDTVVREFDQFARSIESAISWSNSTQDNLDDLAGLLTTAYEEGVRGANDTVGTEGRVRIAERLDQVIAQVIDRLNARGPDGYLFAGSDTTQKPFVLDNAAGSDGAGVSYYGNDTAVKRTVGAETRLSVGIAGSRLTGSDGVAVTEKLATLRDALLADDSAAISSALEGVTSARDHVIDLTAESGVIAERLSALSIQVSDLNLKAQQQRSGIEEADLAETITALQKSQMGLQAAMQAVASLSQNSILNYLR